MRNAMGVAACVVLAAVVNGLAGAGEGPPVSPNADLAQRLERSIGRALVEDDKAIKADVGWLLPQSCPPFYLRDKEGRIIDPTLESEGPLPPVSIEQTCMKCKETHDVNVVVQGYHFEMGRDELYGEPEEEGALPPLDKSPGAYGDWSLLYQRELAPRRFDDPGTIDMTSFEWVTEFGVRHPGGGPAQYDRGGRNYERILSQDPTRALFDYNGDYYGARWHETGVVGPDCLICHMPGYNFSARAQQLKKGNYQWASTEAAGLGAVEGAVFDGDLPAIQYNTNLFRNDGKVDLHIQRPTDQACMYCHTMMEVRQTGTGWHSQFIQDVHTDIGLQCTDCHWSDIRHNFAKGDSPSWNVRNDLDGTMPTCRECHYETKDFGAPAYEHPGLPPLHLERISCESCHIVKRPFLACRIIDTLTGRAVQLPPKEFELETDPENLMFGALWGTLDYEENAVLVPCGREQLDKAAALRVGPDSAIRDAFTDKSGYSPLPEETFTVSDLIHRGDEPDLAGTDLKRKLMLLALEEVMGAGDEVVACVFRGQTNRVLKGKLLALDTELQPRRVGQISQYPLVQMRREVDGQEMLYPMGYQVGAYWAYETQGEIRPLYLRDMEAAWGFLNGIKEPPPEGVPGDTVYQFRWFDAQPPGTDPAVPLLKAAETDAREYVQTLLQRVGQYGDNWKSLAIYDDNSDNLPEVNTEDEMGTIAWAICRTMDRLEKDELYYIKGQNAYKVTIEDRPDPYAGPLSEIEDIPEDEGFFGIFRYAWDDEGKKWAVNGLLPMRRFGWTVESVDVEENPRLAALAERLPWTVAHGVEPGASALGAEGCTDCHAADSEFFCAPILTDPYNAQGRPETMPVYAALGYTQDALMAGEWRERWLKPFSSWLILAVAGLLLVHFAFLGIKQGTKVYAPDIQRFSLLERFQHLGLMVTVVYLAVSGGFFLLGANNPLGPWARSVHAIMGYGAVLFVVISFIRWLPNMFPQKGDLTWLLHMGGYLGGDKHYPAHKFNAGQKILFWKAMALMGVLAATGIIMALNRDRAFAYQAWVYFIHDLAGLGMILLLLGHIYLAALVNPHSVRTLFGGRVSSEWAKEHHPDWVPGKETVLKD